MPSPRRVVILGGGIAGLAAAWELSDPGLRDEVASVTVYQRGWRLGGKGASSRGDHGRIEEHGLHVWLGYYENAFRLMRECYAQLDRARTDPESPVKFWTDAFRPAATIGLGEHRDGAWQHWVARFAENDRTPGEPDADREPLTISELLQRALRLLGDFGASLWGPIAHEGAPPLALSSHARPPQPRPTTSALAFAADGALVAAREAIEAFAAVLSAGPRLADQRASVVLHAIDTVVNRMRDDLAALVERDDTTRRMWHFMDLVRAIVRGILVDRLVERREGYAAVDDVDYREWLARHGARRVTLDSPLVRVVYDLVFGYEAGDPSRPRFSAGTGLLLSGKMFFDYRGAIFWKMTAGMGDVVFAPLYEALRARGVDFRFFHRVDALRLSPNGTRIGAVELGVQARPGPGREYQPLVRVDGLACWPASPRADLLDPCSAAPASDLESFWSTATDVGAVVLRDGLDFDDVVLAIPVGMHRYVCADLIANPRTPEWRAMTEHLPTVATRAMQLWLHADETSLGWRFPDVTVSGYPGAFHTYASMSRLLAAESWPATDAPCSIAYFCDVHHTTADAPASDHRYPAREHARLREVAVRYLDGDVRHLWPKCHHDRSFRWDLLWDATGAQGPDRIDSQYLRVNVDPSDRYVLSLPGTARYRLRADKSGYDNLVLAGDWTDNGLNAGCIEAAVVSGIQAANAVTGRSHLERVVGYYP